MHLHICNSTPTFLFRLVSFWLAGSEEFHRSSPGTCWTCHELVSLQLSNMSPKQNKWLTNDSTCIISDRTKRSFLKSFPQSLPAVLCTFILETFTSSQPTMVTRQVIVFKSTKHLRHVVNLQHSFSTENELKNEGKLSSQTWAFDFR